MGRVIIIGTSLKPYVAQGVYYTNVTVMLLIYELAQVFLQVFVLGHIDDS